jgi:uncharacterized protein involved in exopolysaccharide biosynthesis
MARPTFSLKSIFSQEEINVTKLFSLVKFSIWLNRKIITLVVIIMTLLGTLKYLLTPVEYESKATIIINSSPSSNNLGNLGSLIGINIPANQDANNILGQDMYKDILSSDAFLNEVVVEKLPIDTISKQMLTIESYLQNTSPRNLFEILTNKENKIKPTAVFKNLALKDTLDVLDKNNYGKILNNITPNILFTSNVPPVVNIESARSSSISNIKNRIKLEIKDRNCIISVTMADKYLSALTCQVVLKKLTEYITYYKTQKQIDNISFIQIRFNEAKTKYEETQKKLANYKDNSLGMIFQSAQTREQILSNEMSVAFNIYNQLSVQLELSKLELKKETPVFSFLEPIKIPESSTSGNYFKKLFLFLLIGIGASILIVLRTLFKL